MLHGLGHEHRLLRCRDAGIHQDRVIAQFHGNGSVGSSTDSRIDNQRDARNHLAQNSEVGGVLDSQAAADRRAQRHHGRRSGIDQAFGEYDVIGGVGQDRESFFDQHASRFERRLHVGEERGLVPDHFQLDPVGKSDFARQAGRTDGFVRGIAASGVRQEEIFLGIDVVEQGFLAAIEVHTPHRDRDHVGAAGFERARIFLKGAILARADNQTGAKLAACNDQRVHGYIVKRRSGIRHAGSAPRAAQITIEADRLQRMRDLLIFRLLFGLFVICPVFAQESALDLKQALIVAEASNLELRAARQQRAIALAGLKIAGQTPNPTVSFGAARDLPHESLLWDQPLEIGGQRGKRKALALEEQKTTEIDITVVARQIRRRTREAFYRALLTRDQSEQSKTALALANRIADVVRQRFEAGDVAQLEVIQAEVEAARVSADYDVALQTQKVADAQLAALLSRPLEQPLSLQGHLGELPRPETLLALNERSMASNADILRTTQELATEERRLALAKALRIPNVDLQAGVDLNSPPDFNVGPRGQITVALPLFNRGQGEVAQSGARLDFLRLSLQAQKNNASVQVIAAFYDYAAKAGQSKQYGERIVPQTVKLEEMAEDSYRSGKSNLLTLIDAQRRLNETRKTYLDSLFAVQSSFAVLEEVVGISLD